MSCFSQPTLLHLQLNPSTFFFSSALPEEAIQNNEQSESAF